MLKELPPTNVTSAIQLPLVHVEPEYSCPTRARFSRLGHEQFAWTIRDAQLDVISIKTSSNDSLRLLGSFNFCSIFNDSTITITNVCQLVDRYGLPQSEKYYYWLVVILNGNSNGSILCVIDTRLSAVIKSIECPFRITCAEVISTFSFEGRQNWPLTSELLSMNGILAVGNEGGVVFLIDLCLDEQSTDLTPKSLSFLVYQSLNLDINVKKRTAAINNQVLCLPLNSDSKNKTRFFYRANNGKNLATFLSSEVEITSLYFIPQTTMLCIGFNFAGFQLYNLKTFTLECSCSLDFDDYLPAVISFAFQEPENDPRNYCYLWLIRGSEIEDVNSDSKAYAYMYSMCFERKEWIQDYGYLYMEFQSCTCKFEYPFSIRPFIPDMTSHSRLIDFYTIEQGNPSMVKSTEEDNANYDSSLCLFAWEAWDDKSSSSIFFAIFDINQWYQAQMPIDMSYYNDDNALCPFFGIYSLTEVAGLFGSDAILRINLDVKTITKFKSRYFHHDIHYFPSSLSFEITVVSETQLCKAFYLGLPRRILSDMLSTGPNVFIDPKNFFNQSIKYGLLQFDSILPLEISDQRKMLLTVILENEMIPLLVETIKVWSSGEFDKIGCNCKFILDWIWERVSIIKKSIDESTACLFDNSKELLDNLTLSQLYSFECDLKSLQLLLDQLKVNGTPTTNQGLKELDLRINIIQMIQVYLRILLWFYNINLLPEHEEHEVNSENQMVYPASFLTKMYEEKRSKFINNKLNLPSTEFLLIDGLLENIYNKNPKISELWMKPDGDFLYPPPNLHSLVVIYLLESVSFEEKHALVLYALLDISSYISDRLPDIVESLKLFPSVFSFESGFTNMIQGMWALDNGLYDFAVKMLLDPSVKAIQNDQTYHLFHNLHQRVVLSLTNQEQHKKALFYIENSKSFPIHSKLNENLYIFLLLKNQQILKAFNYQRLCRTESNAKDMLINLFNACEQMNLLKEIFKLSLDPIEEDVLTDYLLHKSKAPNAKQLLLLYFVLNNNIVGAANLLNEYNNEFSEIQNDDVYEKTLKLKSLINSYVTALPQSLTKLSQEIFKINESKTMTKTIKVPKSSVPIKVSPVQSKASWIAPSHVYEAVMEQIESVWEKDKETVKKPSKTRNSIHISKHSPFLRSPLFEHRHLSKSKTTISAAYPPAGFGTKEFEKKKTKEHEKKKQSVNLNDSELLIVLDTPKINRRKSNVKRDSENGSIASTSYFTPTSILKVKQMMRRSTSPLSISSYSSSKREFGETKLRFNIPNLNLSEDLIELDEQTTKTDKVEDIEMQEHKDANDDSCMIGTFGSVQDTFNLNPSIQTATSKQSHDESIEMFESEYDVTLPVASSLDTKPKFSEPILSSRKPIGKNNQDLSTSFDSNFIAFSPPQTRSHSKKKQLKASELNESIAGVATLEPINELQELQLLGENISSLRRSVTPIQFDDENSDSHSTVSHQSDTSQMTTTSSINTSPNRKKGKKKAETPATPSTHHMSLRSKSRSVTPERIKEAKSTGKKKGRKKKEAILEN